MALAWVEPEGNTEHDDEDLSVSRRTCPNRMWDYFQIVRQPHVIWEAEPTPAEEYGANSAGAKDRSVGIRDLLVELHLTLAKLEAFPGLRAQTGNPASGQLEHLVKAARELASGLEFGQGDKTDFGQELIDWRSINLIQWETGIAATLGEDGEPLNVLAGSLTPQEVIEDDDEVTHDARVCYIRRTLYWRQRWLVRLDEVRSLEANRISADTTFEGPRPIWAQLTAPA